MYPKGLHKSLRFLHFHNPANKKYIKKGKKVEIIQGVCELTGLANVYSWPAIHVVGLCMHVNYVYYDDRQLGLQICKLNVCQRMG